MTTTSNIPDLKLKLNILYNYDKAIERNVIRLDAIDCQKTSFVTKLVLFLQIVEMCPL
jgi:hypothetical protein